MKPRVAFKTIGCRLNQAETAHMTAQFTAAGYAVVPFGEACEAAVIHGCIVTRNAERDTLKAARQARRAAPDAAVVVAGCPAQVLGDALRKTAGIDFAVGQADKYSIPALLHQACPDRFPAPPRPGAGGLVPQTEATRALIKVQDGCDFRCAYCIVPDARGAPTSRPLEAVAEEAARLGAAGFKEVVLTGANLGCYADRGRRLVDVIAAVEKVPEIRRIRLSSIEMTTAERAVIDHMAASPKLCRFLHLPLQSGDDRILAAMGRRYTADAYRRGVEYAAGRVPLIGLGADIIVGFPGEDEAAFASTVRLVEALPLSNLHVFPYSRRPGTRAEALPDPVPDAVRKERVRRLLDLEQRKRAAFAGQFAGRRVSVLVERVQGGIGRGWTGEYLEAAVSGKEVRVNEVAECRVSRVEGDRLHAVAD
jgi:threonylcarbamoyladenosine tRNA methylthiotransferase MtaB